MSVAAGRECDCKVISSCEVMWGGGVNPCIDQDRVALGRRECGCEDMMCITYMYTEKNNFPYIITRTQNQREWAMHIHFHAYIYRCVNVCSYGCVETYIILIHGHLPNVHKYTYKCWHRDAPKDRHAHVHKYIHKYRKRHVHINIHAHLHIHMQTHIHIHIRLCMRRKYMYMHIYISNCVCRCDFI